MPRIAKTSLGWKLSILMIGTISVVLLGVGHLAMSEYRATLIQQKTEAFDSVAKSLALSASGLVAGTDRQLRETLSSDVRSSRSDIEYILVSDRTGRTVFAESRDMPKRGYSPGRRWWLVARRILGYAGISEDDIYSVSVPALIGPARPGTLTAGFRLASVRQMVDAVEAKVLLAIAIGLMAGIGCALVTGRNMSNALRSLISGTKAVCAGDLGFRVVTKSGDEIGELSEAFNYMVESLANTHERLVEHANTDSLTGLYNHRYFQERLATEISRALRYNHHVSLLMVDIDFFKNFNDAHGHPMGDAALQDLAQVLLRNLRETDIAVRYGGEEFAIILPETAMQEAELTAERIRSAVQDYTFYDRNGERVPFTVSIGIADCPAHCTDRTSLIEAADVALYQAKALGRNRISSYDMRVTAFPEPDPYKLYVLLHARDLPTIESLAEAIDAKLKFPAGHSRTVAKLAAATGRKLGVSESECASIYLAALLRDIGQIAIPDALLGKTEPLTDEDMAIVASHPSLGHAIVQKSTYLSSMLPAILHHHEHYDGSGYPSKRRGHDIPIAARIIAAADAYQSMVTARPHRKRMSPGEAQAELAKESSAQFDPNVVKAFLKVLSEVQPAEQAA